MFRSSATVDDEEACYVLGDTVESGNESLAVCFVAWYEREVEGAADARVVTVSDTLTFP
jgi:hypothetical protein